MSVFSDLLNKALSALAPTLMRIYNHIRQAIDKIVHLQSTIKSMLGKMEHIVSTVENEVHEIANFQFQPHWRTRVISVPRAIDATQELFQTPKDIVDKIKDIVSIVKDKLNTPEEIEPEEMESDLEHIAGKLGKGCEKILGWITLIVDAVLAVDQALDDLVSIADDIARIRQDLEHLDNFFLPQSNPKRLVDISYRKRES